MTLYVSWGGSGLTDSLRSAGAMARDAGERLIYLAVIDDDAFGDVDGATMEMLKEELHFLLRTQLVGVRRQLGAPDLPTTVVIRRGSISEALREVAGHNGASSALIGGPLPLRAGGDPDDVLATLSRDSGVSLTLI